MKPRLMAYTEWTVFVGGHLQNKDLCKTLCLPSPPASALQRDSFFSPAMDAVENIQTINII